MFVKEFPPLEWMVQCDYYDQTSPHGKEWILYEIIPEAPRPTHNTEKPKPEPHANGVVGSVNSPTIECFSK